MKRYRHQPAGYRPVRHLNHRRLRLARLPSNECTERCKPCEDCGGMLHTHKWFYNSYAHNVHFCGTEPPTGENEFLPPLTKLDGVRSSAFTSIIVGTVSDFVATWGLKDEAI